MPVKVTVTLRLSHAVRIDTVTDQHVVLSGPSGSVSSRVVGAEGGRLAFLRPLEVLAPNTTYTVTEYTYDTSHRMLTVKDPRNIVFLTNEYDPNDRIVRQTQADQTTYEFAYAVDGQGRVIQTDVTNPRGVVRRATSIRTGTPSQTSRRWARPWHGRRP